VTLKDKFSLSFNEEGALGGSRSIGAGVREAAVVLKILRQDEVVDDIVCRPAQPHELEVLTEAVDGVTVGLDARWSVRGEEGCSAMDHLGRTVVADRTVAAEAGSEAGRGTAAGA
jgi:hypothetical protein